MTSTERYYIHSDRGFSEPNQRILRTEKLPGINLGDTP